MLPYLCNPITFRIPIILKPDLLFVQIAWTVKWPVVMRNQLGTRRGRGICVTLQSKAIFSTVAVLADLTQNLGRISAAFCQQCFSAAVCFTRIPDTCMLEILQYKRKTHGFRTFSCFGPGVHSHKTLDTAQPCHLLKPNWKPSSSPRISILTNTSTQLLLQSLCVCVCVCARARVCVCVFVVRFLYNTLCKLFW